MPVPLISIAMPFRNAAGTLGIALSSILSQTIADWELLLCDDGSTDSSLRVAHWFRDSRIRVFSDGEHRGLAARLNECLDLAQGLYIARMDADDVAYPYRLERQLAFLEAHPDVDLVGASALVFGRDGRPIGKRRVPTTHGEIVARLGRGFRIIHPTWMGRVNWFRKWRYRATAVRCEDHELLFRAYRSSVFANLPEILLGYREEIIELRKVLRSRLYWLRCLHGYMPGLRGRLRLAVEAGVAGAKACVDCLAVLTGLQHRLLRHRARPLTGEEVQQWQRVWESVQRDGHREAACSA